MDIGSTISGILASPFICLGWIIVGAIAGGLARQLVGEKDRPFINDLILGLIGAVVGGFILNLLGIGRPDGGITAVIINLVVATIGAVILIAIGRMLTRRP